MTTWVIRGETDAWHIYADGKEMGSCVDERSATLLLNSILALEEKTALMEQKS